MTNQFLDDVEKQKKMCDAAGCTEGLVTKEELKAMLRPSFLVEVFKIGLSIGVPIVVFYGNFRALEAKVELLMRVLKVGG